MLRLPELNTNRLLIRPFVMDDLEAVHRILDVELADADFGTEGPSTRQQREAWLRWSVINYEQLAQLYQPPYGDRAIVLASTGQLIGACGLVPSLGPFAQLTVGFDARPTRAWFNPEVGLYYAVSPAFQRRGYAAEAAGALGAYAFEQLHLSRIVATTTHDNAASIRVMEKIGMRVCRNQLSEPEWFQVVGVLDNPDKRNVFRTEPAMSSSPKDE